MAGLQGLTDFLPGIRSGAGLPVWHHLVGTATSSVANQLDSFGACPADGTLAPPFPAGVRRDGVAEVLLAAYVRVSTPGTGTGGTTVRLKVRSTNVVIGTGTITVASGNYSGWIDLRDANGKGFKLMPGDEVLLDCTAIPGTTASTGLTVSVLGQVFGTRG